MLKPFLTSVIGIIYVLFVSYFYDVITNKQSINNIDCGNQVSLLSSSSSSSLYTKYDDECYMNKLELLDKFEDNKFVFMMIFGFIGIIIGVIILKQIDPNTILAGSGLICGGGLTIISFGLLQAFRRDSDIFKMTVYGIMLIGLIVGSYYGIKYIN